MAGLIISLVIIGTATLLTFLGYEKVAITLLGIPIVGIVKSLIRK
jgi:hypothetical protein